MRIVSLTVGFVALVLAVLYVMFVRAPPPSEVCRHVVEITMREAQPGSPAATALALQLEAHCVADKQRKIQWRGKLAYASQAKCIMAANTLEDIERC